jgi:hypothetical protein
MIIEDKYVNTLIKYKLTQFQLLMLILIYKKRYDLIVSYKQNYQIEEKTTVLNSYLTNDLVTRGFLIEKDKGFKIGKEFYKILIENPSLIVDELFDVYPDFININGNNVPLKAVSRRLVQDTYLELICFSVEEHLEIIEDIKYGVEQKLINIKIDKFIESKSYLTIRKNREINNTFITNSTDYDEL